MKMPLFGKSPKSPAEIVKQLKEAVNSLEKGDRKAEKAQEDISKNLVSAVIHFIGDRFVSHLSTHSFGNFCWQFFSLPDAIQAGLENIILLNQE